MAALYVEHRSRWRKTVAEPGGVAALTALAIDRLAALRLARRDPAGSATISPLPAIARFRLGPLVAHLQETLV